LFWSAALIITGLIINRFNVTVLALEMRLGFTYFPHWMEFAITAGLVADSLIVVWLANRFLPIAHPKNELIGGSGELKYV
jgi:Ni/Fe-hydrogenase subunit HybB-like protein